MKRKSTPSGHVLQTRQRRRIGRYISILLTSSLQSSSYRTSGWYVFYKFSLPPVDLLASLRFHRGTENQPGAAGGWLRRRNAWAFIPRPVPGCRSAQQPVTQHNRPSPGFTVHNHGGGGLLWPPWRGWALKRLPLVSTSLATRCHLPRGSGTAWVRHFSNILKGWPLDLGRPGFPEYSLTPRTTGHCTASS